MFNIVRHLVAPRTEALQLILPCMHLHTCCGGRRGRGAQERSSHRGEQGARAVGKITHKEKSPEGCALEKGRGEGRESEQTPGARVAEHWGSPMDTQA